MEITEINVCVYNRELFPCHFVFTVYLGIDFLHNPANNDCDTRLIRHGHIYWPPDRRQKAGKTRCALIYFDLINLTQVQLSQFMIPFSDFEAEAFKLTVE